MNYSEEKEQQALVAWFTAQYPDMKDLLIHIPNGVNTSPRAGARLKLSGLKAGVPDLLLAVTTATSPGLWIEMKSKDGRVSLVQKKMHFQLINQRYKVVICHSWDEALTEIQYYLEGYKGKDPLSGHPNTRPDTQT
jgi:hypothetical protein